MKKNLFSLMLMMFMASVSLKATVRTVSNSSVYPAQFTSVQAAADASLTGDTLQLMPSSTSYGNLNVSKRLVVLGIGVNNGATTTPDLDCTLGITLQYSLPNANASNSVFQGLIISSMSAAVGVSGVVVEHCYFLPSSTSIEPGVNFRIARCTGSSTPIRMNAGGVLSNSLFSNLTISSVNNISQSGGLISNCIIVNSSWSSLRNILITNNIFLNLTRSGSINSSNNQGCVFNNNLTYNYPQPLLPSAGNSGSGNLENQQPLFVNVPSSANYYTSTPHYTNFTYNYRLASNSPGKNAGTDGQDLGLYGGQYPWTANIGFPGIPQITEMEILNSVAPVNGSLNVRVKAVKR